MLVLIFINHFSRSNNPNCERFVNRQLSNMSRFIDPAAICLLNMTIWGVKSTQKPADTA